MNCARLIYGFFDEELNEPLSQRIYNIKRENKLSTIFLNTNQND